MWQVCCILKSMWNRAQGNLHSRETCLEQTQLRELMNPSATVNCSARLASRYAREGGEPGGTGKPRRQQGRRACKCQRDSEGFQEQNQISILKRAAQLCAAGYGEGWGRHPENHWTWVSISGMQEMGYMHFFKNVILSFYWSKAH